ncbi:MAG: AraC family transcriptional regulator [Pseudomonadota bacterium]
MKTIFTGDLERIATATGQQPVEPMEAGGLGVAFWLWQRGAQASSHAIRHHRIAFEVPLAGNGTALSSGKGDIFDGLSAQIELLGVRRVAVTPAGVARSWQIGSDALAIGLYIHPELFDRVAAQSGGEARVVACGSDQALRHFRQFLPLILADNAEPLRFDSGYRMDLAAALCTTLIRQGSEVPAAHAMPMPSCRRLQRVVTHIEETLEHPMRIAELAEIAALSEFHLMRCFRNSMGRTIGQHILERRVSRAEAMLRGTEAGIAEIADACGFSSQGHFSERFRRLTGWTPAEYRDARRREGRAQLPMRGDREPGE